MAGHSKWSKVKRFKGAIDAKRGKIFSKLSKEINIAARRGGGDPSGNPRLRSAIQAARVQSVPNDNIERAIKRGTGDKDGHNSTRSCTEVTHRAEWRSLSKTATDNTNRTGAEIRSIFSQHNGNLASTGSVSYMFHRKGQITVPRPSIDEA
jgi:YebC/PmpR family DNA-binding regulatory protein